jgi:2'-5' RNA ligase
LKEGEEKQRRGGAVSGQAPTQLSLNFGAVPPHPKRMPPRWHDLFFAAVPDPATAERMREVARELASRHRLRSAPRPAQRLHLSLRSVGAYASLPDKVVCAAMTAGSAVEAAPFGIVFDRALSFRGGLRRPLVLLCRDEAAPAALERALGAAMRAAGLPVGAGRSIPHVALLYDDAVVPETVLREPIVWTVRDFVLLHSLYGQGRHRHLARWPLCGRPAEWRDDEP